MKVRTRSARPSHFLAMRISGGANGAPLSLREVLRARREPARLHRRDEGIGARGDLGPIGSLS